MTRYIVHWTNAGRQHASTYYTDYHAAQLASALRGNGISDVRIEVRQ